MCVTEADRVTATSCEYFDLNLHSSNTTLLVLTPCTSHYLFRTKKATFQMLALFPPARLTD